MRAYIGHLIDMKLIVVIYMCKGFNSSLHLCILALEHQPLSQASTVTENNSFTQAFYTQTTLERIIDKMAWGNSDLQWPDNSWNGSR